ncbi:MAG TPA: GNAT family N-acetyltransferase [Usitatibacter sp.]|nr:GNAT family N-acetyltransferase [Usitatibacter sp.]
MREISFRSLGIDDMQSMFLWLLRPHVAKWYARAPGSFPEVVAKYGPRTQRESPVRAYIIVVDGKDVGYIQAYPVGIFGEYSDRVGAEAGTVGMDLFIGEETFLGWGLGARAIRHFVSGIVFADAGVPACVAGPLEGNTTCIRAFERAGFTRWKDVENERGERECVMRRERTPTRYRLAPIDLARHLDTCIAFRREMYVASFGTDDRLDEEMGEGNATYLAQLRERVAQMPEGNVHLWDGDRIVGQVEMRLDEEPGVGYVSLFYLAPGFRGQGLGQMLHEHAVRACAARGLHRIRLSVASRNAPAIAFYRQLGWTDAGTRPHRLPMVRMEYEIR